MREGTSPTTADSKNHGLKFPQILKKVIQKSSLKIVNHKTDAVIFDRIYGR